MPGRKKFLDYSTNASSLVQAEATVLVLEQASIQQQQLHILLKSSGSGSDMAVRRVAKQPSTSGTYFPTSCRRLNEFTELRLADVAIRRLPDNHTTSCGCLEDVDFLAGLQPILLPCKALALAPS